ncbi:MAG: ankyrin repeat domain-containing protein [Natronospirillum sp.]
MTQWRFLLTTLFGSALILSGCATSAIHEAASIGDMDKLQAYVEGGGDLEEKADKNWVSGLYHYGGKTPLHLAVEGNQPDAVRYLINQGADVEAKSSSGETPLLLSAKAGNMAVFDLLLSYGAERFAVDDSSNTALLIALDTLADTPLKAFETAEALIQRGADVNAVNRWQESALHLAAEHDLEAAARLFIQHGADINALNSDGENALFVSLDSPYFVYGVGLPDRDPYRSTTFEYLVTIDQDFHVKNRRGRTLLHNVCHPDYITTLLDKNAPANEPDEEGETPLFFVLEHCPADAVSVYLSRGFEVKSTGVGGKTLVQAALSNAYFRDEVLSLVITHGADVSQRDSLGRSAIHQAAAHSPQILELVIRQGGDINARTMTDATPLHVAASVNISGNSQEQHDLNNQAYAHLLNKPGIEINPRDANGCTPLHRAVNSGSFEKIQLLIERGADMDAQENRGHTPMDIAVLRGDERMVDLLGSTVLRPVLTRKTPTAFFALFRESGLSHSMSATNIFRHSKYIVASLH